VDSASPRVDRLTRGLAESTVHPRILKLRWANGDYYLFCRA